MRFVLECEVCHQKINEIVDKTYEIESVNPFKDMGLVTYRKMIICDKCKKNLAQLIKK